MLQVPPFLDVPFPSFPVINVAIDVAAFFVRWRIIAGLPVEASHSPLIDPQTGRPIIGPCTKRRGPWVTTHATTKSATMSPGCGGSGKRNAVRWRQSAASTRRFQPNAPYGSGRKIAAALVSKHHWLVIACDSCGTVVDLDLRVKPRDPEASIRVVLRDVQCPRCNGHGRPKIIALAQWPSI